jgi:hypothetical protein
MNAYRMFLRWYFLDKYHFFRNLLYLLFVRGLGATSYFSILHDVYLLIIPSFCQFSFYLPRKNCDIFRLRMNSRRPMTRAYTGSSNILTYM